MRQDLDKYQAVNLLGEMAKHRVTGFVGVVSLLGVSNTEPRRYQLYIDGYNPQHTRLCCQVEEFYKEYDLLTKSS